MKDGSYRVHFSAPNGALGIGLVRVKGDLVFGADSGFLYSGNADDQSGKISGQIHVERHGAGHRSIFGTKEDYEIEFSGVATEDSFNLSGNVLGQPAMRIGILGWLRK